MPPETPCRAELRCWLGQARLGARDRADLTRRARSADALERGRALSLLGRLPQARRALDQAVAARKPAALAWRGELELVGGSVERALADVDAALALDPGQAYARLFRAAACWRLGRAEEASAELSRLPRAWPSAAGLRAMLSAQRGDAEAARAALDEALARGREAWMLGLRAALRARAGDLPGARADVEEAAKADRSPWLLIERADIARRMGEFWVALDDLREARRRLPRDPEPLRRLVSIFLDQAQYDRAQAAVDDLLRLVPGDASALQTRAAIRLMRGQRDLAVAAARDAFAVRPDDPGVREQLARVLSICGRLDEAAAAARGLEEDRRLFWTAYGLCKRGERSKAATLFEKSAKAARAVDPDGERADQAALYAAAAATLAGLKPRPRPERPELVVIGMGYRQIQQMTVGALQALIEQERFYVNHSDSRVGEFLGLFPATHTGVVFRSAYQQAVRSAHRVMEGFDAGCKRVAMVTRGQPIVYGVFAYELSRLAEKRGVPWRLTPSVSIFDVAPALASAGAAPGGLIVRDAEDLDGVTGETPLVVYTPKSNGSDAVARLSRATEPSRRCHLFPGGGEREMSPASFERRGLSAALEASDRACTLLVEGPEKTAKPSSPNQDFCAPEVAVHPGLELLGAALAAAKGGEAAFGKGEHAQAARRHFRGAHAPKSLAQARALGLDDTLAAVFIMHCSPPPALVPALEAHPWTGFAGQKPLRLLLPRLGRDLSAFARSSRFEAFWRSRLGYYRALERPLAEQARRLDYAAALERYTGLPFPARYRFLLAPLLPAGMLANHVHGFGEVWSALGPVDAGASPRLPSAWKVWHELGRTTLDRLLEPHAELLEQSSALWRTARAQADGPSSWRHLVAEHMAQCVALRLWESSPQARSGEPRPALRGLPYAWLVLQVLKAYEKDRRRMPTLADCYPIVLERLAREARDERG